MPFGSITAYAGPCLKAQGWNTSSCPLERISRVSSWKPCCSRLIGERRPPYGAARRAVRKGPWKRPWFTPLACGVNCKVVDRAGKSYGEEKAFPLQRCSGPTARRRNAAAPIFYGGYQAEQLGDYYVYFCPAGLANWAVPVLNKGWRSTSLIGGPVLLHEIDSLFVDGLYRRNPSLRTRDHEVREALRQIPVVGPARVRYLAKLLMRLSKDLMQAELPTLSALRSTMSLGPELPRQFTSKKPTEVRVPTPLNWKRIRSSASRLAISWEPGEY